ncbi:MAG: TerC family protein [Myxococcales bacterium]
MFDFHPLLTPEGLISLASLTALEIVLGIDNIVFIAIVSERIEAARRSLLRRLGLGLALGMRMMLLFGLSWIMGMTRPLLAFWGQEFSGRDLVLLGGGLFLIAKSSHELFLSSEDHHEAASPEATAEVSADAALVAAKEPVPGATATSTATSTSPGERRGRFGLMLAQILILDIVFSLDSVITAVGMARQLSIMMLAMVIAVVVMLVGANVISDFITRHPSMKVLALSFLMMVGVLLIADSFGKHISKGYVYFAMAYALAVEVINIRRRRGTSRTTGVPT